MHVATKETSSLRYSMFHQKDDNLNNFLAHASNIGSSVGESPTSERRIQQYS